MSSLLGPQSIRVCIKHLRHSFISCCYLGYLRVSCDVSQHGNHLSTIQWGHDELDLMISSSILCLLADLFSLPAFDRIMIRFIVQICFGVGGGGPLPVPCSTLFSQSIKNECGCCDSLYTRLVFVCWVCWRVWNWLSSSSCSSVSCAPHDRYLLHPPQSSKICLTFK